jgi:hypothetical protein
MKYKIGVLAVWVVFNSLSFVYAQTSTIIIPASDFLDEIPKGNIITDAGTQRTAWLFNNTGIVLNSETNLMTQVTDT